MTDHYKDFYESRVRELRGERDRLAAENKALARIREAIEPHMQAHAWQCPCCTAVHDAIKGDTP